MALKVFYNDLEQGYHPRHSFFYGRFTPYPDVPRRTRSILAAIRRRSGFEVIAIPPLNPQDTAGVHGMDYLEALGEVCARLAGDEEFFPFHMRALPLLKSSPYPRLRVGYFALDASTPLMAPSLNAALGAAASALAGAGALAGGDRLAYALTRPPGHHAGRENYAGYCLINNAALAAHALSAEGKVAVLDVDFHHGNGTQEIFWGRGDVLYVSLHCRPEEAYPYITGSAEERGEGPGLGANINLPLPGGTDWAAYAPALETALEAVRAFDPAMVVISLGLDTLASDPIGAFRLAPDDFQAIGHRIAQLGRPLLIVQEGGYDVASLGRCVSMFFDGLGAGDIDETGDAGDAGNAGEEKTG
jgi:acetoin utilization deacetylase AcuC-like enzyme